MNDSAPNSGEVAQLRAQVAALEQLLDVHERTTVQQSERAARATAAVQAERTRLQEVFQQAPALISVARGPEHVFELANQPYLNVVGGRDVLGKTMRQALPEIAEQGFVELLDGVYRTGEPYVGSEVRALVDRTGNGTPEEGFFNFVYQPLRNAEGEVDGILTHAVEVTDQVRARQLVEQQASELEHAQTELEMVNDELQHTNETLRDQEEQFRTLTNSLPEQVWTALPNGALDYVNQVVTDYFARPAEEVVDEGWQNVVHPDDLPGVVERWVHSLQTGDPYSVEFRLLRHDGAYRWHIGQAVPLRDENGAVAKWFGSNTDIDDRREAEAQFRTLANAIAQLAWMADETGFIFWYNDRWYEYTGTQPKDMEGWGWQSVHDPEALPEVMERWAASIRTGDQFDMVFPLRGADGVFRPFLTRIAPIRDAAGHIVRWFGTNTDVSEQRQAEEQQRFLAEASALLGSSLDYETTLMHVVDMAVPVLADWCTADVLDEQGIPRRLAIAHPDPALLQIARELERRYPPEPDAPYGVPSVLRTGRPEMVPDIPDELLAAGAKDEEHLRLIRQLGLRSYIVVPLIARGRTLGALTLVHGESGRRHDEGDLRLAEELAHRAAIAVDNARLMTQLQQALTEVRELAAERNAILRQTTDGVIVTDEQGKITFVNPAAVRIHGVERLDAAPEDYSQTYHLFTLEGEPYPFEELPLSRAVLRDETVTDALWTIRRPDGTEVVAQGSATPVYADDGTKLGAVLTLRDITAEQKIRSERERLLEELANSNQELDQFAYVISHDLKAPLRGIANLSEWIEEDMETVLTDDTREQMNLLRNRVHRMEGMIDGILEYSRASREEKRPETVDTGALLAGVVDLLNPPAEVRIQTAPKLPTLTTERLPLEQVFMNLIGNALKYGAPANGTAVIQVDARDAGGGMVEFSVADNGPGIPKEHHEKIFAIFQRLESRDPVEGTGIGLSLVKKLVESRGGRVWLESEPETGTTFRFTWPETSEVAGP